MSKYMHFGGKHHAHQADERQEVKTNHTEVNGVRLSELQAEVGDSPIFTIDKFENWGKTQTPRLVFRVKPTTVEEVQKVVKTAGKYKLKVNLESEFIVSNSQVALCMHVN